MDTIISWKKFDVKAKTHWWRGEFEGLVFFIEKSPRHFFTVTQEGVDHLTDAYEYHNTLDEAKAWIDDPANWRELD